MAYAEILLDEGNINSAQNTVNNMSADSPEKSDYVTYFSVLVYAKQNDINLSELPENKIAILDTLAEGRSIGAYQAQAVLTEYFGKSYPLIVETETGLEFRSKKEAQIIDVKRELIILPNPVTDEMSIQLTNVHSRIIEISINSMDEKLILHRSLDGIGNIYKLNTEKLEPGIYIIQVKDNNNQIITSKFIKN